MAKSDDGKNSRKADARDREKRLRSRIARLKEKANSLDPEEAVEQRRLVRKRLKRAQRKLTRTRRELERRTATSGKPKAGTAEEPGSEGPSE